MATNLIAISNSVYDESTFIEFLTLLKQDRESELNHELQQTPEWESHTIEDFLKRSATWAEMTENDPRYYSIPVNPWQRIAQILRAGKNNYL